MDRNTSMETGKAKTLADRTTSNALNSISRFQAISNEDVDRLLRRARRKTNSDEDAEDIVSDCLMWFHIDCLEKKFEYRTEAKFWSYLFNKLDLTIRRHMTRRSRRNAREILMDDLGDKENDFLESIPTDFQLDSTDDQQRKLVIEVAEQSLTNKEQLELVKRRLMGEPFPDRWSQSWRDTTWSRVIKIVLSAFGGRGSGG